MPACCSAELFGRTVGSPKIEGPVEPNETQRGLVTGTEFEMLEKKLDKLVEESRVPDPFRRKDLPKPLRISRNDIVSFYWGRSRKPNTALITTKFDELEFYFDVRYIGHAKAGRRRFRLFG